jgi:chromosome segregation ATPase
VIDVLKQQLAECNNTISSLSQQLHSERSARSANDTEVDGKLREIDKREAQLTAAAEKMENINVSCAHWGSELQSTRQRCSSVVIQQQ